MRNLIPVSNQSVVRNPKAGDAPVARSVTNHDATNCRIPQNKSNLAQSAVN
jgi:hypothetical protein